MKKKYFLLAIIAVILFIVFAVNNKKKEIPQVIDEISTDFSREQIVKIIGYDGHAMEPFISKDGKYLFFNNLNEAPEDTNLHYAERIDDTNFQYKGEIQGVNSPETDANPTMDSQNNFYFITTRDIKDKDLNTLYTGVFDNGTVKNLKKVKGTINIDKKMSVNMGVEILSDGNTIYVSNAHFKFLSSVPDDGDIRFAIKTGDQFNIPENEADILKNINTDYAIEYAGELSNDGLELYYSQVALFGKGAKFKLYQAKRNSINDPFGMPKIITEPFVEDNNAFVEAPTLTADGKTLYYHKKNKDGKFAIYMLSRN